jgi:tetratricopeptide (TPR) repeat protein
MCAHFRNSFLAAAVLVVAGIARLPVEQAMTEDFRERELLREPLDIETTKKVGQGFWAVSLSGLRTLVATALNLRAFGYFETYNWPALAETYDLIAQLAPHSPYYWDTGSWHMAYNAASHYQYDSDLPPLEARGEWRRWIRRGTAFLEEGTRIDPDSMLLWKQLGWLYADSNRIPDYAKAAEAYGRAVATGKAPGHIRRFRLYAMARSPEHLDEALPLARELHRQPGARTTTMNALRFALESRADPGRPPNELIGEIFDDDRQAYRNLSDYFLNLGENYPMNGVAEALIGLENRLEIPEDQSIFAQRERLEAETGR